MLGDGSDDDEGEDGTFIEEELFGRPAAWLATGAAAALVCVLIMDMGLL
jgi:hypothetical protein